MLPKKTKLFFTALCCSLVTITMFQNCAEMGQFELASDIGGSEDLGSSSADSHLSHSGVTHVAPTEKIADISYSPMVLDRYGVFNLLVDIFGAEAKNTTTVKAIATDNTVFGGACSFYRQPASNTDLLANCTNSEASISVKPHVGVTLLRQGRLNQACFELTKESSKTLSYILKRIDSAAAIPAASDKNALSLFTLFYRTKPMPKQSLIDSIRLNIGEVPTLAGWSRAIYGTCVSGYWQVL